MVFAFVLQARSQQVASPAYYDHALQNTMQQMDKQRKIRVLIEVDQAASLKENDFFKINSKLGNLVTAEVQIAYLPRLLKNYHIRSIEYGSLEEATMDSVKYHTNTWAVQKGWGPIDQAYNGDGIIIGIVDSGIDYSHKEFRLKGDATKVRIQSIWCQWDSTGTAPDSFSYGSEYNKTALENEINGITNGAVPRTDYDPTNRGGQGHGTHVAGIAAGINGMAPHAEIIGVSVMWESASIIDAVKYIINKAIIANKPCVINLSLGSMNDLHDGTGSRAKAYERLANIRNDGTIIVAAAGNSGHDEVHWGNFDLDTTYATYAYGDPIEFIMAIPDTLVNDIKFQITGYTGDFSYENKSFANLKEFRKSSWFSPGELIADSLLEDLYYTGFFEVGGTVSARTKPLGKHSHHYYFTLSIDDHGDVDVRQQPPKAKGIDLYKIEVKGRGKFNAWLMEISPTFTGRFSSLVPDPEAIGAEKPVNYIGPDNDFSVLAPALYEETFSVGSFVNRWSYFDVMGVQQPPRWSRVPAGSLSGFSSHGPTVDGRIQPEIVAPGQNVFSAIPDYYKGWSPRVIDGKYASSSGTSMASPVVAGAVALYLQKFPNADIEQVRTDFLTNTATDTFTTSQGALPNNYWGYGKLDVYKVMSDGIFFATPQVVENQITIYPNPADHILYLHGDYTRAQLFSLDGRALGSYHNKSINTAMLPAGVYLLKIMTNKGEIVRRVAVCH